MSVGDALLCEEEGTSESVMAVKAEGWGGSERNRLCSVRLSSWFVVGQAPPGAHGILLPLSVS